MYTSWGPERTEDGVRTDAASATDTEFTSATAVTVTSSSIGSSAAATSSNAESNDDDDDNDNDAGGSNGDGLKIGLGVGISLGALSIGGAVAFFLWRRKKWPQGQELTGSGVTQSMTGSEESGTRLNALADAGTPKDGTVKPWQPCAPVEMDGGGYNNRNRWHEMDGTGR